jgi:hypothetical protein
MRSVFYNMFRISKDKHLLCKTDKFQFQFIQSKGYTGSK